MIKQLPDLVELAKEHAGRWVALNPRTHEVIASADSPKQVADVAEAEGIECPLVFHVSRDYGHLVPWQR